MPKKTTATYIIVAATQLEKLIDFTPENLH
jgi:hypothetical protein